MQLVMRGVNLTKDGPQRRPHATRGLEDGAMAARALENLARLLCDELALGILSEGSSDARDPPEGGSNTTGLRRWRGTVGIGVVRGIVAESAQKARELSGRAHSRPESGLRAAGLRGRWRRRR